MSDEAMEKECQNAFEAWYRANFGEAYSKAAIKKAWDAGAHARDAGVAKLQKRLDDSQQSVNNLFLQRRSELDADRAEITELQNQKAELETLVDSLSKAVGSFRRQEQRDEAKAEVAELRALVSSLETQMRDLTPAHDSMLADAPLVNAPDDDPLTMPVEQLSNAQLCECVAIEVMGAEVSRAGDLIFPVAFQGQPTIMTKGYFDPLTNPVHTQMVKDAMRERGFRYGVGYENRPPRHWAWFSKQQVFTDAPLTEDKSEGVATCRAALLAVRANNC